MAYPNTPGTYRVYGQHANGRMATWIDHDEYIEKRVNFLLARNITPLAWEPLSERPDPPRDSMMAKVAANLILEGRGIEMAPIGSKKPNPQIPPEIWATPPKNVDYMAAVRALCGGK